MKISNAVFTFSFFASFFAKGTAAPDPQGENCNNKVDTGLKTWNDVWDTIYYDHINSKSAPPSCSHCYLSKRGLMIRQGDATFKNEQNFKQTLTVKFEKLSVTCDCNQTVGTDTVQGTVYATFTNPLVTFDIVNNGPKLLSLNGHLTSPVNNVNPNIVCHGAINYRTTCNEKKGVYRDFAKTLGGVFHFENVDTRGKMHWLLAVSCDSNAVGKADDGGGSGGVGRGTKMHIEHTIKIYA